MISSSWPDGLDIRIGTAGWSIGRQVAEQFPPNGTALQRYAARFKVTEINSSFYRSHRTDTWARWRDSVPDDFRYSVKLPKTITHEKRLADCRPDLDRFVEEVSILGRKLAIFLVQLPPRLMFDALTSERFFQSLQACSEVPIVCEPRHPSWFIPEADALLEHLGISRAAADPAICPEAAVPGGWSGICYWRLHGSPRIYRSSYFDRLDLYAHELKSAAANGARAWCIFDNTASSAAAHDALALMSSLQSSQS